MSKPIFLVPGFGGSLLYNKRHPYNHYFNHKVLNNRWINLYPLSSKYMDRWKKDMHMEFKQNNTGTFIGYHKINSDIEPYDMYGIEGVQNLVPEFNYLNDNYRQLLQNTFHYQYFYTLNQHLIQNGYEPKKNLIGMPYDFRLILDPHIRNDYFNKFKNTIELKCKIYNKKAIIVCHSMGGILFKWFLSTHVNQRFIDKYIDTFVLINTPFGGTPSAVKACTVGDFYVPFMHSLFSNFTSKVSGIIMTLPNHLCYKESDTFMHLENESDSIKLNSLLHSSHNSFQAWRDLYLPYIDIIATPIDVKAKIILSTENQTPKSFYSKNINSTPFKVDYDLNGDGLVPSKSLNYATRLFKNYDIVHIQKSDHAGVLSHPILLHHIDTLLF